MKNIIWIMLLLFASTAHGAVKAFPTAEGFGADAIGGRGGAILKVTNLNDSGAGSLRTALTTCGPRIVIFTVSGTINLTTPISLSGSCHSYLTVAWHTSPGGVQVRGVETGINFQDGLQHVIMRHGRIRPGGPGTSPNSGSAMFMYSGSCVAPIQDIILDHMSLQWSSDDILQISNCSRRVTVQWSLLAEGLADGTSNTYGPTLGTGSNGVTLHHNLLANNQGRVPSANGIDFTGGIVDFVNNVVYNWVTNNAMVLGQYATNRSALMNFRKNHYIAGPDSSSWPYLWFENNGPTRLGGGAADAGGSKIYLESNWGPLCLSGCAGSNEWNHDPLDGDDYYVNSNWGISPDTKFKVTTPFAAPAITETAIGSLKAAVTAAVGAYKPSRDSVDTRIVNDVNTGVTTSSTGYSVALGGYRSGANRYGGPWPDLATGAPAAPTDSDGDGIPDSWEGTHGLNSASASDGNQTAANGWTNIENYLNELAGDVVFGTSPVVIITTPSSSGTFATTASTVAVSGTCTDDVACTSVTYSGSGACSTSGTATGTSSWSISSLALSVGACTLTMTGNDASANTGTAIIVITRSALASRLVGRYTMNSSTGAEVLDTSGLNNHGTTSCARVAGKYSNAVVFDGSCSITVADADSLDFIDAFTLSGWFYPTGSGTYQSGITKNYIAFLNPRGGVCGSGNAVNGGADNGLAQFVACDATPLVTSTWVHLAVTYDGAAVRLYKNGVLLSTQSGITTLPAGTGTLHIGNNQFNQGFVGIIDEVYVYSEARTQGQIIADMNFDSSIAIPPASLKIGGAGSMKCGTATTCVKVGA